MSNYSFEIKPVTLQSKSILDSYFKSGNFVNSELTFTNMFIWQPSYNIRFAEIHGTLCIFSQHADRPESVNFTTMSGDISKTIPEILSYFESKGQAPKLRIFSKEQKQTIENAFPGVFTFEKDINTADYVYKISDLIELPGGRYHTKRNHINKFESQYNYRYQTMTPEFREECRQLFKDWCDIKRDTISNTVEQLSAVNRLLDNWEQLDVVGGCITVDNKMVAFSFGEVLCLPQSMVVIHLEHADTSFQGSFPMINRQFLINQWSEFKYVNREEDMGLEGLRKAKKSYHPAFLTDKYIVRLK